MATRYDILVKNNIPVIKDGDFAIDESDSQHIQDTVNSWPGWWKENPLDGVAVMSYNKSSGQIQLLARKIKIELTNDGYIVDSPIIEYDVNGKLTINPNARRV